MPDELTELFPDLTPILNATTDGPAAIPAANDPLIANPEHGGVTTDDLAGYFQQRGWGQPQFRSGQGAPSPAGGVEGMDGGMQTVTPPVAPATPPTLPASDVPAVPPAQGGAAGDGVSPSPAPAAPSPTAIPAPPVQPEYIQFNGQLIPADRLAALLEFDEQVRTDPALQQRLQEHFADKMGGGTGVPAGVAPVPSTQSGDGFVPPTPPEDLDLDDPSIRALWESHVQTQAALFDRVQSIEQFSQFTAEQVMRDQRLQTEQLVEAGVSQFQQSRNLPDEEVNNLRQIAARLNVIEGLMSGVDPLTGAPFTPNLTTAAARALEIAYYSIPEYRQREMIQIAERQREDTIRKQKLAGVAGTSGSAPRINPTVPQNEAERRAAMVSAVAAMQNGTYTEGS